MIRFPLLPCFCGIILQLALSFEVYSRDNAFSDSLETELSRSDSETEKINILLQLSKQKSARDTGEAARYARQALSLAKNIQDAEATAESLRGLAVVQSSQGNYSAALKGFLEAAKIGVNISRDTLQAINLISAGNVELKRDRYEQALGHYLEALRIADKKGFRKSQSMALCNIGLVHANQSRFDEAIPYYFDALDIQKKLDDPQAVAITYGNIGIFHAMQGEFDAAIGYLEEALFINRERKDKPSIANNLNNIGILYRDKGDYVMAIENLVQSLELHRQLGNQRMMAYNTTNIASIACKQGRFDEAISRARESLNLAMPLGLKDAQKEAYRTLTDAFAEIKRFDSAYAYLEVYAALKDSLFNEESSQQMAEMQAKYEAEKQEERIVFLEKQEQLKDVQLQKKQAEVKLQTFLRNTFIVSFLLALLLGVFWVRNYRKKLAVQEELTAQREEARQKEINQKVAEMRLMALRAQMNPHFVFNALNSIQNFIMKSDKEAGYLYLSKFAKLIRMILDNSPKGVVSIEEELNMLNLYLDLESLRFDGKFEYQLDVGKGLKASNEEIPSMIIQPYVENAIVHGLLNRSSEQIGKLSISMLREESALKCVITDNGVGRQKAEEIKKKKLLTHKSLGLSNTQARLEILNLEQSHKTQVVTEDLLNDKQEVIGTRVELYIPISS